VHHSGQLRRPHPPKSLLPRQCLCRVRRPRPHWRGL